MRPRYDAVLANLPYVADGAELQPEIARYEPGSALFAGVDGLDVIRRLVGCARRARPGRCRWSRWRSLPSRPVPVGELLTRVGYGSVDGAARPGRRRPGGRGDFVTAVEAGTFERCMSVGGVAVFPADTVYGLACDVHNRVAVERLYALKRRRMDKPSAVMFFDLGARPGRPAGAGRPDPVGARAAAAGRGHRCCLPNPERRFPLACGEDGSVVGPAGAGRWHGCRASSGRCCSRARTWPADRRRSGWPSVPVAIRRRADLVIDGGELPGVASTVVDLRAYEDDPGSWQHRAPRRGARGRRARRAGVAVSLRPGVATWT